MHHLNVDDQVYVPRLAGSIGLIQLELTYTTTIVGIESYLELIKVECQNLFNSMNQLKSYI